VPFPPTIAEAGEAMRRGDLDPRALVEQCLDRIARHDARLRAWVLVDEAGALARAESLRDELARGHDRGPLCGIPVAIKDIVDVAGFPTRAGSPLRADHVAPRDAALVASLRRAGAVILGKTVTCQFACFDPSPTRNPWNLEHTPGGSSSGSAAAVAAGMCLGAVGTQTGGSLVRPAGYCGVSTCKPTWRRIASDGVVPVSFHLDHPGPIARTVQDLDLLLAGLIDSWRDGSTEPIGSPKLGLVEAFFLEQADLPVREATETALRRLAERGAAIGPARLPAEFAEVHVMHRRIMAAEAAAYHRQSFAAHRDAYGPAIAGLLDEGLAASAVDYAEALAHQRAFRGQMAAALDGFDALVMPATDTTAPPSLDTTGSPRFQSPWSYAGLPVVSIPCGLASDGLPAAVQLVGRIDDDARLVRVARWCDECLAFREVPSLVA